jgi:hypothetical protein
MQIIVSAHRSMPIVSPRSLAACLEPVAWSCCTRPSMTA